VVNNLLLTVSAAVVMLGTLWPLGVELLTDGRDKISVGPPFFDMAFTPFMVVLAMLLPLGSAMPWKRADIGRAMRPLWGILILSVVLGALVMMMTTGSGMLAPIGAVLAAWVVFGALADLAGKAKFGKASMGESFRRLANLPRAEWGKATAHSGFGVTILGISMITALEVTDIRVVDKGDAFSVGAYDLMFDGVRREMGPNYVAEVGRVVVSRDGEEVATLFPEKRFYPVQQMPTTEAAIDYDVFRDVYVVLGDDIDQGYALRTYIKPFANWIWAGAIIMSLGGVISLTDRRYRVGAAARRRPQAAVPAE